jgi:hypothetical protein
MRAATLRIAPATVKARGPPSGGDFGQAPAPGRLDMSVLDG